MGSVTPLEIPPLTPLERVGPKGYLQYVFPFELPENYELEEIAQILKEGYNAASQQLPVLACEAVPDPTHKQAGVMKLQEISDSEVEAIVVKDLRAPGAFPMSYAELKAKSFPVSAFETDVVMRRTVWASPGDRLRVSQVQANFIQGGVVLGWSILHMFGDGTTFQVWTQVWAEECRRAQGLAIEKPIKLPEAIFKDRERVMKPSGESTGLLENHPEYTLIPFTPQGAPPKMLAKNHRGQVFYFSRQALIDLKEEASPTKATQPSDQSWISTNDALSALLWRTVMSVQYPIDTLEGDPTSVFNIAIDGRLRTSPPIHPQTLGCFLEYVAVAANIRKMLTSYSLADIAIRVREAVGRAKEGFTDDVITLIDKHVEDVDRLVPTAFLDVPGFNCVQTSWINFALYDIEWGQLGKIQAVRSPSVGVINGLQVIFPVLPDGGLEVLVGVEDSCIDRLLHEPLWNKFAKAR
ncbi:transferase family-domain-containing protein [Truncatella angustata]|uniref:Transferase family-domain-containing protein n=1 Tax=Truncatella angustata TaxID=152316 RepID=A0A9P9A105_9PEZI|nr:transferase family-domain-containing protein [Truncatella angustata]KAH6657798.1 transferase family-domain-containing protein [Truncatella angustata]KAH8204967.1 hypothetical protein TruAng_000850 [Truncatella angustata]